VSFEPIFIRIHLRLWGAYALHLYTGISLMFGRYQHGFELLAVESELEFSLLTRVAQNPKYWNVNRFLYAEIWQNKLIIVKFAPRHCAELHHFCAERGHALKLLGYGAVPGGWNVVVMDFVAHNIDAGRYASTHWNKWYEDLTGLVKDFHDKMVHGDLRDANFIVTTDEPAQIMLVDLTGVEKLGRFHSRLGYWTRN
jgi:hypothetical protein